MKGDKQIFMVHIILMTHDNTQHIKSKVLFWMIHDIISQIQKYKRVGVYNSQRMLRFERDSSK